jgi:hypothetical protein
MTPEKEKVLKEHIQAIAKILYEETSPEQLRNLESIEATVRHQVTEYVSPQIGIFLSNKQPEQAPEESGN